MTEPTITVHDGNGNNPRTLTKAQYEELCKSGMMWEFHPDAPEYWPHVSPVVSLPPIVAFTGAKFSGKGTAARFLLSEGYQMVSFARPLKEMLIVMGLTEEDLTDPILKEQPHPLLGGKTPRWAMQSIGTEWGRELIYDGLWTGVGLHRIERLRAKGCGVVVDDCRFNNEAILLRDLGAPLIEVTRAGCSYNPAHKSEAGVDREHITASVENNGTPEELHARVRYLLNG
jgi:hypothetical protein